MSRTLGDLGEHEIVTQLLGPRYGATDGFGDDCAVLTPELVATTDSCPTPLVSVLGDTDLFHSGWLLATINLSDLAAAGAEPLGLLPNYVLPKDLPVDDFRRLLSGVDECLAEHGTQVVGGDLRDGDRLHLSATAVGRCAPGARLSRRGARPGDKLVLVGSPGYLWAAALVERGLATLPADDRAEIWSRACRPRAQVRAGRLLAEKHSVHAAMDVSDGLYSTVATLCAANGLGARMATGVRLDPVLESVCRQVGAGTFDLAATWGDWCLLVAVAEADVPHVTDTLEDTGALVVGTLVPDATVLDRDDEPWRGVAQERFTDRSWQGDIDTWLYDQLGLR